MYLYVYTKTGKYTLDFRKIFINLEKWSNVIIKNMGKLNCLIFEMFTVIYNSVWY